MPHVIIKLWPGRTEEQKRELTDKIVSAMMETFKVEEKSISVGFEEVAPDRWDKDVYEPEIAAKKDTLYKMPGYGTAAQ